MVKKCLLKLDQYWLSGSQLHSGPVFPDPEHPNPTCEKCWHLGLIPQDSNLIVESWSSPFLKNNSKGDPNT